MHVFKDALRVLRALVKVIEMLPCDTILECKHHCSLYPASVLFLVSILF